MRDAVTDPVNDSAEDPTRDSGRVIVFDTTLRDGEQAPGFSMGVREKVRMAEALAGLGVDIIEAGFAAASPGDAESIRAVAEAVEGPVICSLSRAQAGDIDACAKALSTARAARLHIFLATSPIHREFKLKMTRSQVLEAAHHSVAYGRQAFEDVEFSAEDAIRTERDFLLEVLRVAALAGAKTLNVPDTVGYSTPEEICDLFRFLADGLADFPDIRLSTHCHDDLGMAVANSLAAIRGGARQVEGAINGIGERAGNCAIEEVIMALKARQDFFGLHTGCDSTRLVGASRLLAEVTANPVSRNKAIVGRNAFAHEAGIHQHGMMSDSRTYEIMRPQDVGFERSELVLGKHSGKHAIGERARSLGFVLDEAGLSKVFVQFKHRADDVGEIDDKELLRLLRAEAPHAFVAASNHKARFHEAVG
jgi:2-isopropylmalate synthase